MPASYSLFPPLGLATLAGYLRPDDGVEIQDEHVEKLRLADDGSVFDRTVARACRRRRAGLSRQALPR